MQPLRLYIENFMGNKKSDLDFTSFKSCLVVGKNKHDPRESNGVGKSTIFKAIDFVLFGKYPSDHIEEIIFEGAEKCTVSLEFEAGGSIYRAIRIRHSRSELKLEEKAGDKWIPKGQRTSKQATIELKKLVPISYGAFNSSVLFAQGDLSGLAEATPDKRKAMLKEPLQLAVYSKFEEIAKKKTKKVDEELLLVENQIKALGNPQETIDEYSKRIEKIVQEVKQCKNIVDIIREKNNKYIKERDKISKKLESASGSLGKLEVLNTKIANQQAQINKLNSKIEKINRDIVEKKADLRGLELSIKLLNDDLEKINVPLKPEEEIEQNIKELRESEEKGIAYLAQTQAQIDACAHTLPGEEVCPQCQQGITDDYRETFIKENSSKKDDLTASYKKYYQKLTKIQTDISNLKIELKNITKTKAKITSLKSEIQLKESKIENVKEIIEQFNASIKDGTEALELSMKELAEIQEEHKLLSKELEKTNVTQLQNKENELNSTISETEKELNEALNNSSMKNRELGNAESTIDRAREDLRKIENYSKQKIQLAKQIKTQKRGIFAFSPKGIPTLIINTILDDLQFEVNSLLQELRPELGMKFIISKDEKDTLDIIFTVDGKKRSYSLLSGGQKMYIALSLKMGLSLLIQKKLNVNINFLELDEVDQSLDKAGVEAFADVIRKWQDKFKIFVVTHNDSLKNKFSHAILVEKGKDGAHAKVVTQW